MSLRSTTTRGLADQSAEDPLRVEIFAGDVEGGSAVSGRVGGNLLDAVHGLLHGAERKHASASRDGATKPGVLDDDGDAKGEVAGAPTGEPTAPAGHVRVFGDAPLAERRGQIVTVAPGIGGQGLRVHQLPPVDAEVFGRDLAAQCQLQGQGASFRERHEATELAALADVGDSPHDGSAPGRLPGADGGEDTAPALDRYQCRLETVEHDGLADRDPLEQRGRYPAVGGT